jgi:dihydrofolate reductase
MAKIMVGLAVSVDGYIAGPNDGPQQPLGEGGDVLFDFYSNGDTPSRVTGGLRMSKITAEFFDAHVKDVAAVVTGRRTYDISNGWNGDSPVPGTALFVLTHRPPDPLPETTVRQTFVTDGIESAVAQAAAVAGDRNVALAGSQAVQQCLRAGLLDEFWISVVPVLLGGGVRLFDNIPPSVRLEQTGAVEAPGVTHLGYRVIRP